MSSWKKMREFFGFEEDLHDESPVVQERQPVVKSFKGSLINPSSSLAQKFGASEIKVEEPRIYEDSLNIATCLREGKPVIVNLKYLDADSGRRLIDFVCGTAYAINGHMMKIGENIFIFTPSNIMIADASEKTTFEQGVEQEEKEVFFKRAAVG